MSELSDLVAVGSRLVDEIANLVSALSRNGPPQISALSRNSDPAGTNLRESAGVLDSKASKDLNPQLPAPKDRASYTYPVDFEGFWKVCPLKKDKADAYAIFRKITQRVPANVLIDAMRRYRDDRNREPAFTKYPARWLRSGAYEDEDPLPPRKYDPAEAERLEREAERQRRIEAANRLAESTRGQPV